jgi:hypothetical protein
MVKFCYGEEQTPEYYKCCNGQSKDYFYVGNVVMFNIDLMTLNRYLTFLYWKN